jgi:hypothetical protein
LLLRFLPQRTMRIAMSVCSRRILLAWTILAAGCGSSGSGGSADGASGGSGGGGAGGSGGASGTGGSGGAGGAPTDGGPRDTAGPDVAAQAYSVKQIVPGRARLLGTHLTACSNAPGATTDRWCAFSQPSTQMLGSTELWVINATKAMAAAVTCDGTNNDCRRLSSTLFTAQPDIGPAYPTTHRFDGDTLIFHADVPQANTPYKGPIYAWRPEWTAPRRIGGMASFTCFAHETAVAAACIENLSTTSPLELDVTGGPLTAPASTLGRVVITRPGTNSDQWSLAFSDAGDYIVWSTGGKTLAEVETLYAIKTDEAAMPARKVTFGPASRWSVSADGKKVFFLRDFNYNEIAPTGTLMSASFPAGGGEVMLAPSVGAYVPLNGTSIGIYQNVAALKGTFKLIRDIARPQELVTLGTDFTSVEFSSDLRFVAFATTVNNQTGSSDNLVVKSDGTGRCALNAAIDNQFFGRAFVGDANLIVWAQAIGADVTGEGWVANPDGCADKRKFADKIDFWFNVRKDGLIYSDGFSGNLSTLKFVKLTGGTWPASTMPTTIAPNVLPVYGIVGEARDHVVYNILDGTPQQGLYLAGPLGFGKP